MEKGFLKQKKMRKTTNVTIKSRKYDEITSLTLRLGVHKGIEWKRLRYSFSCVIGSLSRKGRK